MRCDYPATLQHAGEGIGGFRMSIVMSRHAVEGVYPKVRARLRLRPYSLSLLGLAWILSLAGCSGGMPPLSAVSEAPYRLDSGDRVRIMVFGQAEITDSYTLDDGGLISLPLIGQVPARGLTTPELEARLKDVFNRGVLADASVSVEVELYRPFYILGEVAKPGQYPYANRMTVLTAVAIAGGFTSRAKTDNVAITRRVEGQAVEGVAPRTAQVSPGDVIVVHERFF